MRCHQCNQDSIKIIIEEDIEGNKKNSIDKVRITCDVCGLDIDCCNNSLLCKLFIYNEDLEEAEESGKEALIDGKEVGDNPFSLESNQIISNKRWELGYNREKESYEYSALSFSSEKIKNDLESQIKDIRQEKEKIETKINTFLPVNNHYINDFCSKLLKIKILGRILSKNILSFKKKYKQFLKEHWDSQIPGE